MNPIADILDQFIPVVGEALVEKTRDELLKLSEKEDDAMQKLVLSLVAEAVEEMGPDGIALAQDEIRKLLNGKPVDLNWASPRTASDAVALLQNAERERREKVESVVEKSGRMFGVIGAMFVKAAAKGAFKG